jgi:hypothetical protein
MKKRGAPEESTRRADARRPCQTADDGTEYSHQGLKRTATEDGGTSKRVRAADSGHALTRTAPHHHHHLRSSNGHLPRAPGRAGIAYLGSSEIGYSLRVRGLLGAGSRSALPLRFSVIVEYGGLIP